MLAQRLRRCANIIPASSERLVFADHHWHEHDGNVVTFKIWPWHARAQWMIHPENKDAVTTLVYGWANVWDLGPTPGQRCNDVGCLVSLSVVYNSKILAYHPLIHIRQNETLA